MRHYCRNSDEKRMNMPQPKRGSSRAGLALLLGTLLVGSSVVSALAQTAAGTTPDDTNPCGPAGFNGQSNLVPAGFPTPTTATECLRPDGPPRDPGPLTWAQPGPYMSPA